MYKNKRDVFEIKCEFFIDFDIIDERERSNWMKVIIVL